MKEFCKERNNLYEKQNDLKGQKQKREAVIQFSFDFGICTALPSIA